MSDTVEKSKGSGTLKSAWLAVRNNGLAHIVGALTFAASFSIATLFGVDGISALFAASPFGIGAHLLTLAVSTVKSWRNIDNKAVYAATPFGIYGGLFAASELYNEVLPFFSSANSFTPI